MATNVYIHGYSKEEQERLQRQAELTEFLIYQDVNFFEKNHILEVGGGVAAQTQILLRRFPQLKVTSIDVSDAQLAVAREVLANTAYAKGRYDVQKMDATKMAFPENHFDGCFMAWVLEHIPNPTRVLSEVRRVLKPGSIVVITEVMNFSFFLDPYCPAIWNYWMTFNDFQYDRGGDPFVGVKLGSFLRDTGFSDVTTELKTMYVDKREPESRRRHLLDRQALLLSGAEELVRAGKVEKQLVHQMELEFRSILENPDAIMIDIAMQARARVP
jgi:SAM-dependent methyltransferase